MNAYSIYVPLRGMNHFAEENKFAYIKVGVIHAKSYQDAFVQCQNDTENEEYLKLEIRSLSVGDVLMDELDLRTETCMMVMGVGFRRIPTESIMNLYPEDIDHLAANPELMREYSLKLKLTATGEQILKNYGGKLLTKEIDNKDLDKHLEEKE